MKLNKESIEQVRVLYEHRHDPESRHLFADTYWRILLLCTGVLVGLCILSSAGILIDVLYKIGVDTSTNTNTTVNLISRAQLQKTIELFQSRQAAFNTFKATTFVPVGDPS